MFFARKKKMELISQPGSPDTPLFPCPSHLHPWPEVSFWNGKSRGRLLGQYPRHPCFDKWLFPGHLPFRVMLWTKFWATAPFQNTKQKQMRKQKNEQQKTTSRCLYLVPFWPLRSFFPPKCRPTTPTRFGLASVPR